jgi:Gas vesicle synthesis protein GvpL/GvpF
VSSTEPTPLKYIYGVVRAPAESRVRSDGVAGGPVGAVVEGQVAALTSDVPDEELRAGRDELKGHARVLEEALEGGVVLPMRFGVVMESEDSVRHDLLERHGDDLLAQLDDLEGKVELNVKAIYEEDALMREVVQSDSSIARLRESLQGKSQEATYYERIRLGEMVSEAVEGRRERDAELVLARLRGLAGAVETGAPVHERMAVNASFLVEHARVDAFDEALEELGGEQAGRMRFKLAGPLPPHSFVQLEVEA